MKLFTFNSRKFYSTKNRYNLFSLNKKNLLSFCAGLFFAVIFLYISFRGMDWPTFLVTLRTAKYQFLLLAIPIAITSYIFRGLRWRVLLSAGSNINAKTAFWANMVGYLGNAFLPARLGELLRSYILGGKDEKLVSFIFATAITERLIDLIVLIGGILIFIIYLPLASGELLRAIWVMALTAFVGLIFIFLFPGAEAVFSKAISKIPLRSNIKHKVIEIVNGFVIGIKSFQSYRRFSTFMLYTFIIWGMDTSVSVIYGWVIGHPLYFYQAFLLLACLGISSAIPSTPGYIGVYQYVAIMILVPFGLEKSQALAYILVLQVTGYLVVSFLGLLGLWKITWPNGLLPWHF